MTVIGEVGTWGEGEMSLTSASLGFDELTAGRRGAAKKQKNLRLTLRVFADAPRKPQTGATVINSAAGIYLRATVINSAAGESVVRE
jgi:hypothetical protein